MNKLVSSAQMRALEKNTFDLGLMPAVVMETAAASVSNYILQKFGKCTVTAVCGKGNNGGDRLAAARQLFAAGCSVTVVLAMGEVKTPEAKANLDILKKLPVKFSDVIAEDSDVIIDALLGIGINGGADAEIIDKINSAGKFVVSVDIPSGVCADTGAVLGKAVYADTTVTFGYKKTGLTQYPAKKYCGDIIVAPVSFIDSISFDTFETDCPPAICGMEADFHKGLNGKLLVIAGSKGMTGAATLACTAALRCGCGLVTLAIPENLNAIMEVKLTEAMTLPLDCCDSITYEAFSKIDISQYDCIVIGPGLGRSEEVNKIVKKLVCGNIPLVIDADGINSIKSNIDILKDGKDIILTPHPGEFAGMLGKSTTYVQQNRINLAREFATEYGVTLVLKGAGTVTAQSDGRCTVNTTGNCGMATGGSGDVLAGIIGAFAARKFENPAETGVYLHGLAGDMALEKYCAESMLPSDTVHMITKALQKMKK